MFFIVASLGMPGLGNFVGEFLILLGAFQVDVPITIFASLGLIVAAVYSLVAMQRVFQGTPAASRNLKDFDSREVATMVLMMLGLTYLGIHPQPIFDMVEPTLSALYQLTAPTQEWVGFVQYGITAATAWHHLKGALVKRCSCRGIVWGVVIHVLNLNAS